MNIMTFPLDVTDYSADALGAWFAARTRGVFAADGHYHITTKDNMSVTIGTGLAWLRMTEHWGVVAFNQDPVALIVPPAENATHRIDAVCLQLDKAENRSRLILKKGVPSADAPPPPVRNASFDEIYLATITVPAGAASIQPHHITDQRLNEAYCGIMSDGAKIPTQQLHDTWMAWFEELKTNLDEDAAGALYNLIGSLQEDMDVAVATLSLAVTGQQFTELDDIQICCGTFTNTGSGWQSFAFPREFDGTPAVNAHLVAVEGNVMVTNITRTGFQYQVRLPALAQTLTVSTGSFFTANSAPATSAHIASTLVTGATLSNNGLSRASGSSERIVYQAIFDGGTV
ncbi:MAG: hypothetical protein FWD84_01170 [Oscillospiraceae bacterium]|nr:hypothetical protein [Oscillospiraceae bacterium]